MVKRKIFTEKHRTQPSSSKKSGEKKSLNEYLWPLEKWFVYV